MTTTHQEPGQRPLGDYPAFPAAGLDVNHPMSGLTIRQYLAAHAPAEPQPWFTPILGPRPEDDWRHSRSDWRFDTYSAAVEHCQKHGGEPVNANWDTQRAWDNDRERQRFIQWPWAWADALLREDAARTTPGDGKEG